MVISRINNLKTAYFDLIHKSAKQIIDVTQQIAYLINTFEMIYSEFDKIH